MSSSLNLGNLFLHIYACRKYILVSPLSITSDQSIKTRFRKTRTTGHMTCRAAALWYCSSLDVLKARRLQLLRTRWGFTSSRILYKIRSTDRLDSTASFLLSHERQKYLARSPLIPLTAYWPTFYCPLVWHHHTFPCFSFAVAIPVCETVSWDVGVSVS